MAGGAKGKVFSVAILKVGKGLGEKEKISHFFLDAIGMRLTS